MIFLYFLLDIAFYNYTSCQTALFLLAILEKWENKYIPILASIFFDYLLHMRGRFALIFIMLYLLNKYLKVTKNTIAKRIFQFSILLFFYTLVVFLMYHKWTWNLSGLLVTFFFVVFSYKKKSIS